MQWEHLNGRTGRAKAFLYLLFLLLDHRSAFAAPLESSVDQTLIGEVSTDRELDHVDDGKPEQIPSGDGTTTAPNTLLSASNKSVLILDQIKGDTNEAYASTEELVAGDSKLENIDEMVRQAVAEDARPGGSTKVVPASGSSTTARPRASTTNETAELEKMGRPQRDSKNILSGSAQAADRLMKELKNYYRSDSFKNGLFTVELVDDNLFEWHVKLFFKDPESKLHKGLLKWKANGGLDHVKIHIIYPDDYPFEPPFVRLIYPYVDNGYLQPSGIFCMHLLTRQGWNSDYTAESLILQLYLVLSDADYVKNVDYTKSYTLEKAVEGFKFISEHLSAK